VEGVAARHEARPSQVALAWVLAQGSDVVPIPGTKRMKYLEENADAVNVTLSADDLAELEEAFAPGKVSGARYGESSLKAVGL
jgi:aryl-alcohol dehydrogenase-like predicted oxidoreductase